MRRSICKSYSLIRSRLGLELGNCHWFVLDVWAALCLVGERVLEKVSVVALGIVLARVRTPAFGTSERARDCGLGAVEQIPDLARLEQVRVEDVALVVDRDVLVARLELTQAERHLLERFPRPIDPTQIHHLR